MTTVNALPAYPLRVRANGRYIEDSAGTPFFWLGDTAWALFGQYSRASAEAYLADRAAKGFTVIQAVLAWGGGTGVETRLPGPNYAGDPPWLGDPTRPNEAYFRNVDHLVQVAAELHLVLGMLPTWGYYVNNTQALTSENALTYGRWLGARYKDCPNIIWVKRRRPPDSACRTTGKTPSSS